MKIFFILTLFLSEITGLTDLRLLAATEKFELKTSEATLTIDQNGNLKIIQTKGKVILMTSLNDLWKLTLMNNINGKEIVFVPDKSVTLKKTGDVLHLVKDNFSEGDNSLAAKADLTISVKDDAFCFSGILKSESEEWIFKELNYPDITRIQLKSDQSGIFWPQGLGQYYDDPESFGDRSLTYPGGSGAAMPWFSMNSQNTGIYVGIHDPLQEAKILNLAFDQSAKAFKTSVATPVYSSEYIIPDIMVKVYSGEWYVASKFYRGWWDKHFKIQKPTSWTKDDSGWLLAILKQQNLEVMWPYKDIDKLCDIADHFNLSTIGLFGWGIGGHDQLYPNYTPDPLMGGREELKKAIERAHARGKKIIIYANGVIMDAATDFYKYNGFETMVIQQNRQPDIMYFIKQKNTAPVIFAQACSGSEIWRNTMYNLGLQAATLGADGILYDMMGISGTRFCFSSNHDHRPGMTDAPYRLKMIKEAIKITREINPEFIVMTEGTNDEIIRGIEYHHGCGVGTAISQNAFPSLFRYTFPELIETQRNPNPMITRADANFAAVHGLRHEIESRYPGDVEYLLNGTLPTAESYANQANPPDVTKMNLLPAKQATDYVFKLIEFEKTNHEFFRFGRFIDSEGIEVSGKDIYATGFLNGKRLGVVVWNKNETEKREYSISVPGYRLVNATGPEKGEVSASSPVDANSIRLLIFEKI